MPHFRSTLRADVSSALEVLPALIGVKYRRALSQRPDADQLPEFSVLTPRERSERGAVGESDRRLLVVVVVRRLGGSADEQLDDDSAVIEAAALPVLASDTVSAELIETQLEFETSGSKPMGQLTMTFEILRYTAVGSST